MAVQIVLEYVIAGAIRYLLMNSDYRKIITERVEISTPLNAWERATEAAFIHDKHGIDPYTADIFHDTPLNLEFYKLLLKVLPKYLPLIFVFIDLLTATFLYFTARAYMSNLKLIQIRDKAKYCKKSLPFLLKDDDFQSVPVFVLTAFLFNPFIILNCVAMTTTVLTNLFLGIIFYGICNKNYVLSYLFIAIATSQTLYPTFLIVPFAINIAQNHVTTYKKGITLATHFTIYGLVLFGILYLSYHISGSWNFLNNTFGFILNVTDLRPNIGTTWYFFTEMFEHFRLLFIWSLQINVTILYLVPLSLKFRKDPLLLAFALTALTTIFRTYPSIGDVGFYLSLLPTWKHLLPFMQQRFIICCIFLLTSVIGPVFWHLWIYSGAANANFYFGVTLAFTVAQIFVLTDMLFAYINRQYILKKGCLDQEDLKKYKLILW
ncbi:phosphatidylinositol glycan anchor biosynthesis class U protein [Chrysoperla carnea]|uniref:phosphatidylinositol glycan anchor biosynthesis class U protein n=1 Tax=Chrysoperla carnea TaxID=189513 RepID=UPI001D07861C|nr:phosphatidylinositol glycan anchor biosynthesis class U protein [Chrysoperla carnea]